MSGGSYDYAYVRIEEFALAIRANTPERKAFKALMFKVAKAAHDIEWVDSCDNSKGSENAAIMECITQASILEEAISHALQVKKELEEVIAKYYQSHKDV